jgi:hypothetical protein
MRVRPILHGELNEAPLNEAQDYFVRTGAQPQRVDLSKLIDRSYMSYAVERLGRIE